MKNEIGRRHVVACLVCVLLASTQSGRAADFTAVAGQEYRELNEQPTEVSGLSVVGMSLISGTAAENLGKGIPEKVFARTAKAIDGKLRVDIASSDGLFRGEGVFSGKATEGEWIGLSLVPKVVSGKKPAKAEMNRFTVAVLVRRMSGEQSVGPPLVVSWDEPAKGAPNQIFRLYVNSRRAAEMRVRLGAGTKVVVCDRAAHASGVRFDAFCDVPVAQLPQDRKVVLIRSDGFEESSQTFTVDW